MVLIWTGITGYFYDGDTINTHFKRNISGNKSYRWYSEHTCISSITNCYFARNINDSDYIGGIVEKIINSYMVSSAVINLSVGGSENNINRVIGCFATVATNFALNNILVNGALTAVKKVR
ncbi:MAG: hypothetical protein LBD84_04550 [Campylobacteraceae bacterium]|nr:hypothetical protein [Campylobacteraceae bacterium]